MGRPRKQLPPINIGDTFGQWTVVGPIVRISNNEGAQCRCECGFEKRVGLWDLTTGASAGCRACYMARKGAKPENNPNYRHGMATHDTERPSEYGIWLGMKRRCANTNDRSFRYYGARGVKVHPAWVASFPQFLTDVGPRPSAEHSIDRIDPHGHYEPRNVRWATDAIQGANKRNAIRIKFQGETLSIMDLSRRFGLSYFVLHARIARLKWTVEKAVTTPLMTRNP